MYTRESGAYFMQVFCNVIKFYELEVDDRDCPSSSEAPVLVEGVECPMAVETECVALQLGQVVHVDVWGVCAVFWSAARKWQGINSLAPGIFEGNLSK